MKKSKRIMTLILSAVLWISTVSPAFGAEFFSAEDDAGALSDMEIFSDSGSSSDNGISSDAGLSTDTETVPDEEISSDSGIASDSGVSSDTGIVSDTGVSSDTGISPDIDFSSDADGSQAEEEPELFDDGSREELLQGSGGSEIVCTVAPIVRKDAFTPIGTGCDTPSPEEVLAQAGPELFRSGEEEETADPADVAALVKASDQLREAMVNRSGKVQISLKLSFDVDISEWDNIVYTLLLMAFEETGNSWEGDYLRWNFQETGEGQVTYDESIDTYGIYLPFVFYTTASQEKQVTTAVNKAIASLGITDKTTPYLRIRRIYEYVCSTVVYDEEHCEDISYVRQFTAYGAIIDKTAVCQGYSLLLYRMLMEAGIENRMIPSTTHIWNLALLRGSFYNLDPTWDGGVIPEYYKYFLKGTGSFETDLEHIRDTEDPFGDYTSQEFEEMYPTSVLDYTVQDSDIPENGECIHTWGDWVTVLKSDCTFEGVKCQTCVKCGEENYDVIPKTAHKWKYTAGKTSNTHVATCSVCKTSKTLKCTFKDNLCTKCKRQQVPAAAKLSKVKAAAYNKLTLTWNAVEGASGYVVYYLKGSSWVEIGRTAKTTYTHKSTSNCPVKTGVTCYFRIRAYCTVNNKTTYGVFSTKLGGKTMAAKPVLVSVKAKSYNQVALTWKKAAGATHYLIYRKNGSKWERVAMVQGADITSYVHKSNSDYPVYPGTEYTYTVRSYTKTGNTYGLYDKTGIKVKTCLGKPSLTVSRTKSGLKTTWKKVNGASGYLVQRYASGKWTTIKNVNSQTLSFVDSSAKKGVNYKYRVCAYRVVNKKKVNGKYSAIKAGKR